LSITGGGGVAAAATTTTTTKTTTTNNNNQMHIMVDDSYLILFHKYYNVVEHESILSKLLFVQQHNNDSQQQNNETRKDSYIANDCVHVINRDNVATKSYPSDFALIRLQSHCNKHRILDTLRKSQHVIKYVTTNSRMNIQLLSRGGSCLKDDVAPLFSHLKPGRAQTTWSRKLFQTTATSADEMMDNNIGGSRSSLATNIAFQVNELWEKGITGKGVHIAIFDTGLCSKAYGFKYIDEQINYTYEDTPYDSHGHGTFVASVIAGNCTNRQQCCTNMRGLAPDSHLHIFKVFTKEQISYTSWFLDAFNYALQKRINILNLSIGGPDYMDMPFVDKIRELAANNIIIVSAIGNDGPLYGTLNNPADLSFVFGIGAIDHATMRVASFSSRGMSTYELSMGGYGRMKPDLVTFGSRVLGHNRNIDDQTADKCQSLSGTSVASPVATGVIALLLSASYNIVQSADKSCFRFPELERQSLINPSSIKQILVQSAQRLPHHNMFEQGSGKIDLLRAFKLLVDEHKEYYACKNPQISTFNNNDEWDTRDMIVDEDWPRVTLHPSSLDFTQCPYTWPFCAQPLYYSQMPTVVNITILNGISQYGQIIDQPEFIPDDEPSKLIHVDFTYSKVLKIWTGYLALHISVEKLGRFYSGTVSGKVKLTVRGKPLGYNIERQQTVYLPIRMNVIPTPPRAKRLLWDQYHQLIYPSASYVPKDDLTDFVEPEMSHNIVDWNGDHPHTNFLELFNKLIRKGYYIEVLNSGDWTTFDAKNYGALLIVDPEDEIMEWEARKLQTDIEKLGLSVVIFADWYNEYVIRRLKFLDDNTQSIWVPITGGSNIPALNGFLHRFGIMLGDIIFTGPFSIPSATSSSTVSKETFTNSISLLSSSIITHFPLNGELLFANVSNETPRLLSRDKEHRKLPMRVYNVPILGLYKVPSPISQNKDKKRNTNSNGSRGIESGKIAIFTDSNCLDMASKLTPSQMCLWLMEDILAYTNFGKRVKWMDKDMIQLSKQSYIYTRGKDKMASTGYSRPIPKRLDESPLYKYSRQPLQKYGNQVATFNISQWYGNYSTFFGDELVESVNEDVNSPVVSITARVRIITPIMIVFILMLMLVYMSFTRKNMRVFPQGTESDVRPHAV
jgi:subtilisin family serine protease